MPAGFDSPWKEALDSYFDSFLSLLFPDIHAQIDWSRGYESLDKEFQQVVRSRDWAAVCRQAGQGLDDSWRRVLGIDSCRGADGTRCRLPTTNVRLQLSHLRPL